MKFTGIIIVLIAAINQGNVAAACRNLKSIPTTLMMFYHGIIGLVVIWIYIAIEAAVIGELRMSDYTTKMWLISSIAAAIAASETVTTTLAYQKDRAGFSSLLSYLQIVYAFVCDKLIF